VSEFKEKWYFEKKITKTPDVGTQCTHVYMKICVVTVCVLKKTEQRATPMFGGQTKAAWWPRNKIHSAVKKRFLNTSSLPSLERRLHLTHCALQTL